MATPEFFGYLESKTAAIVDEDHLRDLLDSGRHVAVKFGIDPTTKDVHLGHIVPVMLLSQFIKKGHAIDFVIGDITAKIGDPSGRTSGREVLSESEINKNLETYATQISNFIDANKITFYRNSTWLDKIPLRDLLSVFQSVNLSEAFQRDDFRARAAANQGVSLAEVCYPLLMGLDSIALKSEIEVGGIDQLLNFHQARNLMKHKGLRQEVILVTPIIEGTSGDGRKMSKSFGNYIAVNDSSSDIFGKIMSIRDELIAPYFQAFGHVHIREVDSIRHFSEDSPMEAKKQLATLIVGMRYADLQRGLEERESFEQRFSRHQLKDELFSDLVVIANTSVFDALMGSGHYKSRGELRRLFDQDAVKNLGEGAKTPLRGDTSVSDNLKIAVGKRGLYKVRIKNT
ncbi:MAG TPA: tyrosine--tRNA ligase [Candidatus Baltobacteraceae bacterium]|jgi:tyrosyl-tRNA synthetase|nr:tyrosine--tRNA ligase [Candidatus Baltobacteraceae bacterium]